MLRRPFSCRACTQTPSPRAVHLRRKWPACVSHPRPRVTPCCWLARGPTTSRAPPRDRDRVVAGLLPPRSAGGGITVDAVVTLEELLEQIRALTLSIASVEHGADEDHVEDD